MSNSFLHKNKVRAVLVISRDFSVCVFFCALCTDFKLVGLSLKKGMPCCSVHQSERGNFCDHSGGVVCEHCKPNLIKPYPHSLD